MLRPGVLVFAFAPWLATLGAQEPVPTQPQDSTQQEPAEEIKRIECRISATRPGAVVAIDRGSIDGVAIGDRVLFYPKGGGTYEGGVIEVAERLAVVEMLDRGVLLGTGTRGEVLMKRSARRERRRARAEQESQESAPEHPPWQNQDESWTPDMPLLSQIEAMRPEDRARSFRGRLYTSGDATWTSLDNRSDSFFRFGQDLSFTNPFGRGGELNIDLEENYRTTELDDAPDEDDFHLRIDRFSYAFGGTRFDPNGYELGRFLQRGMPEFGVLDGFEYGRRLSSGDRIGASIGYMPEPDPDYETGQDFQMATYYRWFADDQEQFSLAGGYQKTFHNADADRDLFVANLRYLPPKGWSVNGTAWVDLYTSGDDAKGAGPEFTQAYVTTSKLFESGDGVSFAYNHQAFPEIDREEFLPVAAAQLADDRSDRLSVSGWTFLHEERRLHGQTGVWNDEDETGGDLEIGLDVREVLVRGGNADVTLFGTKGQFSAFYGARLIFGRSLENGRWDLLYEIAHNDEDEFPADSGNFLQHRARATRDFYVLAGWNLSGYLQGLFWDGESSGSIGFYLQRSF